MVKTRTRFALRPKLVSLAVASCFATGTALANPTGHHVVRGTADIHRVGNLLQITNSPSAIINWQSFSIGANEITRFIQQSNSSAVLNRVTTQNPSQILGALQSRLTNGTTGGKVFLINPNGIVFGQGSKIDVGGLVASTLNLTNEDFVAGKHRYGDGIDKGVVNQGSITTATGGNVYLVGSDVTNGGIIRSPKGEVVLAAGKSVELVNPGTPNLKVTVTASKEVARNLGQIVADAGRVGIYAGLINNSGTIRADSAVSEGGRIMLKATQSTTLENTSVLSAQGKGGGRIDVLADESVHVAGRLDASAPNGGNGGFIETSAKEFSIDPSAVITTKARFGKTGTWLIDPVDFTIAPTGTPGDITGATLSGFLNSSNIEINTLDGLVQVPGFPGTAGLGSIFVNDTVSWNTPQSLTLIAIGNVVVSQPITATNAGSAINLYAGWNGTSPPTAPVVQCCGQIGLNAPITAGDIKLVAGFFITQTRSGVITANRLMADAPSVSLSEDFGGAPNMVNFLAGRGTDGSFRFSNGKALTIDTVAGVSGVTVTNNNGSANIDIVVTGGDLTVNRNVTATAGTSVEGPGQANIFLATRSSGNIVVQGGAVISAVGGDGGEFGGSGGNATVELNTAALSGGSITVRGGSRIDAFAGNAFDGSSGSGSGGDGRVTLLADGAVTVDASTIRTRGGDGFGVEASGGRAEISLTAGTGPVVVNQSSLSTTGGAGGSSGGGTANVSLFGNGINVSASTISATGGGAGGGSSGGSGSVSIQGNSGAVTVTGGAITAKGGLGAPGTFTGDASVVIGTSSDATISGGTISASGSEGSITIQANKVTMANNSLSASSDDTGCCASTGVGVTAASSVSMTGTSTISANADGAEGGSISVTASAGGIVLGRLVTDAEGSINVSASGGSITDGNAGVNLQTPFASLSASSGIGSIGNPLETLVGQISLFGGSGEIGIINTGNLQLNGLSTSGSAAVGATGMMTFGSNSFNVSGNLSLISNGMYVNRNVFAGGDLVLNAQVGNLDIVADGGEGFSIGVSGNNVFLLGANVNVGSASAPFATSAVANNLLSVTTPGNVTVTGGSGTGANTLMRGGVDVAMSIGGTLQLNGSMTSNSIATVEAGSPLTINLAFPSLSADGFSVNGILNAIEDNGSGFFVMGSPAILNENMFVTYGGPPPFTDILTATMNQQVDVLADQLKAGDTGEGGEDKDKKKLPFCDG